MTRAIQKRFRSIFCSLLVLSAFSTLARAESVCRYIEHASLDISQPARSTAAMIDGEVNGKPVKMLLDTGSYATFMLRAEAENQNLHPLRTSQIVHGAGGRTSMFVVNVKDFAIGSAHAKNMRFPVLEAMENSGLAGIVGDDFLLQYDVDLDFANKRVKLFHPDHCQDRALAYWDKDAMTVPMKFTADSTTPLVQVKINGVALWALLDTGADSTVIDLDTARKLGFSQDAPGVTSGGNARGVGSETRTLWQMTFDSFAIGDELIQHPRIGVMDRSENDRGRKEHQVVLGRDFLMSHHVLLAQSQMLLYYSYLGGPVFLKDVTAAINVPGVAL